MQIHPDILRILNETILPNVVRIHDMDTPWPAELWIDGECKHKEGTVMFNVNSGRFLTAEYFGYDNAEYMSLDILADIFSTSNNLDAKLVMSATEVEIPIWNINQSRKARTIYSGISMPVITAYECHIQGWIGGSASTEMPRANITLVNMPDIRLPRATLPADDEDRGLFVLRGRTARKATMKLEAGGWNIELTKADSIPQAQVGEVYYASLRREDYSRFFLSDELDDNAIVDALHKFLSFQCGNWIGIPTIVCAPASRDGWVIERAWAGRLVSTIERSENVWIASEWRDWPELFKQFWNQYDNTENRKHLNNAIYHFVESERIFRDGAMGQALVETQSTLQALTRWWNDQKTDFQFGRGEKAFKALLMKAVKEAELGKDNGLQIDEGELERVIGNTIKYRNGIGHGRGGDLAIDMKKIIAHRMYCHDLARLLLLAKLGDHGRDARGNLYSPGFIERTA